jgi:hypothetical protein
MALMASFCIANVDSVLGFSRELGKPYSRSGTKALSEVLGPLGELLPDDEPKQEPVVPSVISLSTAISVPALSCISRQPFIPMTSGYPPETTVL